MVESKAPREPTPKVSKIKGVRRYRLDICVIELIKTRGIIFWGTIKIKLEGQEIDIETLTNQKWTGATPNFINKAKVIIKVCIGVI